MGCTESSETVSIDADEEAEPSAKPGAPTTKPGAPTARKKVKKKSKRRSKQPSVRSTESETGPDQADSTTIHVIWRRISVFGGRRDSTRSNNSGESDKAGPSPKPPSGP